MGKPKENTAEGKPVGLALTAEQIAMAVNQLATAVKTLQGSRLTQRAVLVLLQDATKLPRATIQRVLDGLDDLQRLYVKR